MTLLLDTHVIIWALTNDPQLSMQARTLLSDPGNLVMVSAVSLWEIAGYLMMDIKPEHILTLRSLRVKPSRMIMNHDPFDRLLIAQAKSENCKLLSHDRNFETYDEECIYTV